MDERSGAVKYSIHLLWLAVFVAGAAVAQQTRWGGSGRISTSPETAPVGQSVAITYTVTQSRGHGAADFRCEVIGPGGCVYEAAKRSSAWSGGTAAGHFSFPKDFAGNDEVAPSTDTSGTYRVYCYWNIEANGVNGKVAACIDQFEIGGVPQSNVVTGREFRLVDDKGASRAVLSLEDGNPVLQFLDERGKSRASVGLQEYGPSLFFARPDGRPAVSMGFGGKGPSMAFADSASHMRILLNVDDSTGMPAIVMRDTSGHTAWTAPEPQRKEAEQ
jgi:hypothetical protein